jgi:hypothetical protein
VRFATPRDDEEVVAGPRFLLLLLLPFALALARVAAEGESETGVPSGVLTSGMAAVCFERIY